MKAKDYFAKYEKALASADPDECSTTKVKKVLDRFIKEDK